jgi:hypothetical protein
MTFSRLRLLGLIAALLTLTALPAQAQAIWKWRDKDGRMQISDRAPPPEVAEKDILQRPPSASAVAAAQAAQAASLSASGTGPAQTDAELEARKRKASQEQATQRQAKQTAEAERLNAAKADNCQRARSQLAMVESGQRMSRPNEKGERVAMDDRARQDEAERARLIMRDNCQ